VARIFIVGATGVLGRRLVRDFRATGHEVAALARSERNVKDLELWGATPRAGDVFDVDSLAAAMGDADVVIHAATSFRGVRRLNPRTLETNNRLRIEGTRNVLEAAKAVGVSHVLKESIVWVARPDDGSPFDEASPANPDAVTRSAFEAETMTAAAASADLRTTRLRLGFLYAHDSEQTRAFAQGLARGRMGTLGRGDAPWAMLHADDASSAFVAAVERQAVGLWHIVDDRPITSFEVLSQMAQALGAKAPKRLPRWLARLAVGSGAVEFFTNPMSTSSAPFQKATGWRPRHPSFQEGLQELLERWSEDGFLKTLKA
jgi:nucleoside-diphosphate-sugar epimerase